MISLVRVLHVLPHHGGGAEKYIQLLERLPGSVHERFYLSGGRAAAAGVASIPLRWWQLPAHLRSAEVVHVHGDAASVLILPLLRLRPAVITTHGLHMLRRMRRLSRVIVEHLLASAVHACTSVICTSVSERSELAAVIAHRDVCKLRVIQNGVDAAVPIDGCERIAARRELGAGPGTILGLFMGQLEPRKAPLLAARAAIRVHALEPRFTLAIAGHGPQTDELEALQGDAVHVLGYRNDAARLLGAADLFVQPSEREGMSLALLEAMSYGLPVVAADGPGNPEALGDAGVLFQSGDEDALVEALTTLCARPQRRAALGEAARARALEQFSSSRFVSATLEVYREAMAQLTAPAPTDGASRA